jgi:thiol-disulfide isomerase/thioredoxin
MRPLAKVLVCAVLLLFAALPAAAAPAGARLPVHFFWGEGCPHCEREKAFLAGLAARHPAVEILSREVRGKPENARLFSDLCAASGVAVKGVPATFIGAAAPIIGFDRDETTGRAIEARVVACLAADCGDPLDLLAGGAPALEPANDLFPPQPDTRCGETVSCSDGEEAGGTITLPLLGAVDPRTLALPYLTVAIAGLDGFNPCAFFVLFTLLGLLLHVHSRKRILLVGGIFVLFSGLLYFLFMAAWLNVFLLTGQIAAVTKAAGVIALVIGAINVKDFFFFKQGVSLSIPDAAKPKLYDRMRRLIRETSLLSVTLGTIVLAAAANAYELFCTAGFPMVYTRILTLHRLSKAASYGYLALYNAVYVLPLAAIVLVFAWTLGTRKLSERQGQVLKLFSGMMMLGLGGVLLLRPEALSDVRATAGLLCAAFALSGILVLATRRARP